MTAKHELAYVKKLFEQEQCIFLDDYFKGVNFAHNYKCRCGKHYKKSVSSLKQSWRCKECRYKSTADKNRYTLDEVKKYFSDRGCEFLDDWYINNRKLHNYRCKCGRTGKIRFCNFFKGKRCTKCAGNTKLKYDDVKKMFEDAGCKLISTEYKGALSPLQYICNCGTLANGYVRHFRKGRRCYNCSPTFDRTKQSFLYLIANEDCFKIGIYNEGSQRLREHNKKKGFRLVEEIGPILGYYAENIEETILKCLDAKGISRGERIFNEYFSGYTEAWLAKDFHVDSIADLWDRL